MIGELGKGYKYAIETLNMGRIGIGAQVSDYLLPQFTTKPLIAAPPTTDDRTGQRGPEYSDSIPS